MGVRVSVEPRGQAHTVRHVLMNHPIFGAFESSIWATLAGGDDLLEVERGTILFERGTRATECFVVHSGRIGLISPDPWQRPCMIAIKSPGDVVGDLSLFDDTPRTSTARVLEHSVVIRVPYAVLHAALMRQPEIAFRILGVYARQIRYVEQQLLEALNLDLLNRLARRLLDIARGQHEFDLDITQEEIASLVGASRERTNKALAALQRAGALRIRGHHYEITDEEKLRLLALRLEGYTVSDSVAPRKSLMIRAHS